MEKVVHKRYTPHRREGRGGDWGVMGCWENNYFTENNYCTEMVSGVEEGSY